MKKFILTSLSVFCSVITMMAQFVNTANQDAMVADNPGSYSLLSVGYDRLTISSNGVDESTSGVALQFTKASSINSNTPLYVEWGIRSGLGFYSDSEDIYYSSIAYSSLSDTNTLKYKLTTLYVSVPLNLAYRLSFAGTDIALTPYTGLHARGNIIANIKFTYGHESETINCFDKDDMGKDYQWKRFQYGWHIGARFSKGIYHLGFEYGIDFNEICKRAKTSSLLLSLSLSI